jgi:sterol 3beta-glucosyltransferase
MAKRIFVATQGSRGDVEPFIALGKALQDAGYDVTLSAPPDFYDWIASFGLTPHAAGEPAQGYMADTALAIENNTFFREALSAKHKQRHRKLYTDLIEGGAEADLYIYSPLAMMVATTARRRAPTILAFFQACLPTGDFASPLQPRFSYGRALNRLSHKLLDLAMWNMTRPTGNNLRAELLGLEPLGRFHDMRAVDGKRPPHLFAISETLVPRPRDWPDYAHMTGPWFLDSDPKWRPSPELAAFLETGPKPIYVGFGSMPFGQFKKRPGVLLEALRLSGQRAVLAHGWGEWSSDVLAQAGADVHVIDGAPHGRLFPLMAGVVHHGGAGATTAALRAGCPSLVTPLMADQFFSGHLVARHGAGPRPLPVKQWRADILAERLIQLTQVSSYADRARDLSRRMAQENGTTRAVEIVQGIIGA